MHVAPLAAAHTTWKQSEQSGHAATGWMRGSNEPSGKIRSLGIDCCARAASGHDTAAPPRNVMNVRRLMSDMGFTAPWVATSIGHRPSLHMVTISHTPGV